MATHRIEIQDGFLPDPANAAAGPVYWQPSNVLDTNHRYVHDILVFTDSGNAKDSAAGLFTVPKNYVSTPVFVVVWRSSATTGTVVWSIDYQTAGGDNTTTMDPSTDAEAGLGTGAAAALAGASPGSSAMFRREVTITPQTAANFAVDKNVFVKLARNPSNAADTMAASAIVEKVYFQYADV